MELDVWHKLLLGAIGVLWTAIMALAGVTYTVLRRHSKFVRGAAPVISRYRYEAERNAGLDSDPPSEDEIHEERTGVYEQQALEDLRRVEVAERRRRRKSNPGVDALVEDYVKPRLR